MIDFDGFARAATGHAPYDYQRRIAVDGLPDLLRVPTGSGKTLAAVLPWLYRRRLLADDVVRASTPRRLVLCLPQRSLVEQTRDVVRGCLERLHEAQPDEGWDSVEVHLLMGGASTDDRAWKLAPEKESIVIGTQDMVLSRLLMRGYGEARASWPMSFGLLHSDSQFVFDETQLMGPGLGTSIQLDGFRRAMGTAAPSRSMWMSATLQEDRLSGFPDHPRFIEDARVVELSDADRAGPLRRRLEATRLVRQLRLEPKYYSRDLAAAVLSRHRPGTRSLVVLNTVDSAVDVHAAIAKIAGELPLVLLHSRFRPDDRAAQVSLALEAPGKAGAIVVATQVLEAGIDITSSLLVTELAPWSSIVQRAGRCNRAGDDDGAELWWVRPARKSPHLPYEEDHVAKAAAHLGQLEGRAVTNVELLEAQVDEPPPLCSVLRRRDLMDLFDTAPDLAGNDLDVSRWIRDADERTVSVAWRKVDGDKPESAMGPLRREELCPVPIEDLREFLGFAQGSRARAAVRGWAREQPSGGWVKVDRHHVRPGSSILLDAASGGYRADLGWNRHLADVVSVLEQDEPAPVEAGESDSVGDDSMSSCCRSVTLKQHLKDVGEEIGRLLDSLVLPGVLPDHRESAVAAGFLHDLGKVHQTFQNSIVKAGAPESGGPWAKSGSHKRLRHEPEPRRYFRHELASALALLGEASWLLPEADDAGLTIYLVAAHHGKVRLAARPVAGEAEGLVFGIADGDTLVGATLADERVLERCSLSTSLLRAGADDSQSWTARACRLRDRDDLGVFRLAFLEALVRSADWRVSKSYDEAEA